MGRHRQQHGQTDVKRWKRAASLVIDPALRLQQLGQNVSETKFPLEVGYDAFKDPTTMSNLYHKLKSGFFEPDTENINEKIVPFSARTPEFLASAANELLMFIGSERFIDAGKVMDPTNTDEMQEIIPQPQGDAASLAAG